jgi:hypothetical protein
MIFQEWNETCGMKLERSGHNLAEKYRMDRDLKKKKNYFVLFFFKINIKYFNHFK